MRFARLGPEALTRIAELCRRALVDAPELDDLQRSLFGTVSGAKVIGEPDRGVVVTVVRGEAGCIRLLAVDPDHRGRGMGRALIRAAEEDLAAEVRIKTGADAPDYLWPGIDVRETAAISLFEAMGYETSAVHYNMSVNLNNLPSSEGGVVERPEPDEREAVEKWLRDEWPNWLDEALSGFDRGFFLLVRDEKGIAGFSAWNVNRRGWFGPTAVRRELIGKGFGRPLLIESLRAMREEGMDRAEIAWVGPHRFYSRTVGAIINRTFWVLEKSTRTGGMS